jgi:energy-coupling factor transport system permease protein
MIGTAAPVRSSPLDRLNPLVALLVIGIVALTMIVSFRPVTALVMIAAELPLIMFARLSARAWAGRVWPLAGALAGIMIANLLFTDVRTGGTLLRWGPLWVTADGLAAAGGVALRLLALAVPGIVLFARLDPTDLSDALIAHWHARPRISVGSLAALRLAPLVLADLRQSYAARRTRGLVGRNPVTMVPVLFGSLSAVLVTTVRRASRLSTAMDSRGFDSGVPRTLARESRWRRVDTVVVLGYLAAAVLAVVVAWTTSR